MILNDLFLLIAVIKLILHPAIPDKYRLYQIGGSRQGTFAHCLRVHTSKEQHELIVTI